MKKNFKTIAQVTVFALFIVGIGVTAVYAAHSWGSYHWARTANPFTLKLGDNVSTTWDSYLATASSDWSLSSVLDTTIVPGSTNSKPCKPKNGQVNVCSNTYGFTGWLGVASIWVNNSHITQGTVKLNDSYFNTATYNTSGWRNFVMCQEIGHTFGLDHQDVIFDNLNLGSCMDYTDDPDGIKKAQLSNEHPNQHDYDQLESIYSSHFDTFTTLAQLAASAGKSQEEMGELNDSELGKVLKHDGKGHISLVEQDLGKGKKLFTFVFWAE